MTTDPQPVDNANTAGDAAPIPLVRRLTYRQTKTIEQRVERLERLLLLFMALATVMALFVLAMIWAFLRITHQI